MIAKLVKVFKFALSLALLAIALAYAYKFIQGPYQSTCENEKHDFNGKEYIINLCAIKNNIGFSDVMRIQIYSKDMELLVDRTYEKHISSPLVEYENDRIAYIDANTSDYKYIQIPPTKLDWIRARLP